MSEKIYKNVNFKQCINTIIWSIIGLVVFLIPMTFGSAGLRCAYEGAPFIGDGTLASIQAANAVGLVSVFHLDAQMVETVANLLNLATTIYIGILAMNVLFCLLLFITRSQILRLIFKIISILAGFFMIINLFCNLAHIIGFAGLFIMGNAPMDNIMLALESSGILFALGMMVLSGRLAYKQFKWYDKRY